MHYFTRDIRVKALQTKNFATYFGAKGDGVTDDTAALQTGLNELGNKGGGVLFLPTGIYQVSSPLKITSDYVGIQGETMGQPFTFGATAGGSLIRAKSGFSGNQIVQ